MMSSRLPRYPTEVDRREPDSEPESLTEAMRAVEDALQVLKARREHLERVVAAQAPHNEN